MIYISGNLSSRILGYNVCDVLDSAHSGIVKNWLDFMNGECTIEDVVKAYHQHGYGTKGVLKFQTNLLRIRKFI